MQEEAGRVPGQPEVEESPEEVEPWLSSLNERRCATADRQGDLLEIVYGKMDGFGCYHLPEFKGLCAEIGLPWELLTINVKIRIVEGEIVKIIHEYVGTTEPSANLEEPLIVTKLKD